MRRRTFLSSLLVTSLLPAWSKGAGGWVWLRWPASRAARADIQSGGRVNLPTRDFEAPLSWGKGPCLVLEQEQLPGPPCSTWIATRGDGRWAYRVESNRNWGENQRQMTLACPEFQEQHFETQHLPMVRSVLKGQQEEAGIFASPDAGQAFDKQFVGKSGILRAPTSWAKSHFGPNVVAFLEVAFI